VLEQAQPGLEDVGQAELIAENVRVAGGDDGGVGKEREVHEQQWRVGLGVEGYRPVPRTEQSVEGIDRREDSHAAFRLCRLEV
jgi:hypothetical protein